MTYAVYAYRPLTLRSLQRLLEHEALGQRARFERFAADMMYMLAAGRRIDPDRTDRFGAQVDRVYADPFAKKKQAKEMTAAEIKQYLWDRMEELKHGLNDAGGQD